jgi:hypothetical protein
MRASCNLAKNTLRYAKELVKVKNVLRIAELVTWHD